MSGGWGGRRGGRKGEGGGGVRRGGRKGACQIASDF